MTKAKKYVPTEAEKAKVCAWSATGFSPEKIAVLMNMELSALKRAFARELAHGATIVAGQIALVTVKDALKEDGPSRKRVAAFLAVCPEPAPAPPAPAWTRKLPAPDENGKIQIHMKLGRDGDSDRIKPG